MGPTVLESTVIEIVSFEVQVWAFERDCLNVLSVFILVVSRGQSAHTYLLVHFPNAASRWRWAESELGAEEQVNPLMGMPAPLLAWCLPLQAFDGISQKTNLFFLILLALHFRHVN